GGDVSTTNDEAYWIATDGTLHSVAREGDPASGLPAGTILGGGVPLSRGVPLSDSGQIVFNRAFGVGAYAIWSGNDAGLRLVAYGGEVAPGAASGASFTNLAQAQPSINRGGGVAFAGSLTGQPYSSNSATAADGIWTDAGTGPHVVAILGQDAEGIGGGSK